MEHSPVAQAVAQLLPMALIAALSLWMSVQLLHKAGYSGRWALLTLVPFVNIAMVWAFALSDWPALKARS